MNLMETTSKMKKFTTQELKQINLVCLYYKVIYLSELCNLQGTSLDSQYLYGKKPTHYTPNQSILHQPKPGTSSFKLWRRLLKYYSLHTTLKRPLGDWTSNHSSRGCWKSYYCMHQQLIFRLTTEGWFSHSCLQS